MGRRERKREPPTCFAWAAFLLVVGGCYQFYAQFGDVDLDVVAPTDADGHVDHGVDADVLPEAGVDVDDDHGAEVDAVIEVEAGIDADADADAATCVGGWYDPTSGLCWQDPPDETALGWRDAVRFCDGLVLGGRDDWHLPTISELRSLIRGCPGTVTGGSCGVTDTCLDESCSNTSCGPCLWSGGPGTDGAYWPPDLNGSVQMYWSSSFLTGDPDRAWVVAFGYGSVGTTPAGLPKLIRCVRPGP